MNPDFDSSYLPTGDIHLITRFDAIKGQFAHVDDTTMEYPDRYGSDRSYVLRLSSNRQAGLGYCGLLSLVSSHVAASSLPPSIFGLFFDHFTPDSSLFKPSGNETRIHLEALESRQKSATVCYRANGEQSIEGRRFYIPNVTVFENSDHLRIGGHFELNDLPRRINFEATQYAFLEQIMAGIFTNPQLICP